MPGVAMETEESNEKLEISLQTRVSSWNVNLPLLWSVEHRLLWLSIQSTALAPALPLGGGLS